MARGWESKSVESQIESAPKRDASPAKKPLTEAQIDLLRQKETLLLSRKRILHELDSAANPRYRDLLQLALQDLDAKLAKLES